MFLAPRPTEKASELSLAAYEEVPLEAAHGADASELAAEQLAIVPQKRSGFARPCAAVAALAVVLVVAVVFFGADRTFNRPQHSPTAHGFQPSAVISKTLMDYSNAIVTENSDATTCGMNVDGHSLSTNAGTAWEQRLAAFEDHMPDDVHKVFSNIVAIFSDVVAEAKYAIVWGDFAGSWMLDAADMTSVQYGTGTNQMLVDADTVWGTVATYVNLPCATDDSGGKDLKLAFIWNTCGTYGVNFMFSWDPSILSCTTLYPGLQQLIDGMTEMSFGLSLDKKFSKQVTIAHGDDGEVTKETLTMYGHLALAGTMEINLGEILKVSSVLGDLFSGSLSMDVLVSFDSPSASLMSGLGTLGDAGMDAVEDLTRALVLYVTEGEDAATEDMADSFSDAAGTAAKNAIYSVITGFQSVTFMMEMSGFFNIQLATISKGILPDIAIELAKQVWVLKTAAAVSGASDSSLDKLAPGFYTYISVDLAAIVEGFVKATFTQIDSMLSLLGVSFDADSFDIGDMNGGIGLFFSTDGIGFHMEMKISSISVEVKCFFGFSKTNLKCSVNGNWAELFLEAAIFVLGLMTDFFESGWSGVSEWSQNTMDLVKDVWNSDLVETGKKNMKKWACKNLKPLSLGQCDKKQDRTSASCGDGTEYVISTGSGLCLGASKNCDSDEWSSSCKPTYITCTHESDDFETQMKSFWFMTSTASHGYPFRLCNEFLFEKMFLDIEDPDNNPACIHWDDATNVASFKTMSAASEVFIAKKDYERFKIKFSTTIDDNENACMYSEDADEMVEEGDLMVGADSYSPRRRDGRRRRRDSYCEKTKVKTWRIKQKLDPTDPDDSSELPVGIGKNYESENGDNQFSTCEGRRLATNTSGRVVV